MSIQIERLVGLAHFYIPVEEREELMVKSLVSSLDNKAIQCHLLRADTSMVVKTVNAIEDYLVVRGSDWPICTVVGKEGKSGQFAKTGGSTDRSD